MKCPLDRAYLIKLLVLNKKFIRAVLMLSSLLGPEFINIGIRDLAVQFSCTEAVN